MFVLIPAHLVPLGTGEKVSLPWCHPELWARALPSSAATMHIVFPHDIRQDCPVASREGWASGLHVPAWNLVWLARGCLIFTESSQSG